MKKKISALFITGAMALSFLVGCGDSNSNSGSIDSKDTADSTSATVTDSSSYDHATKEQIEMTAGRWYVTDGNAIMYDLYVDGTGFKTKNDYDSEGTIYHSTPVLWYYDDEGTLNLISVYPDRLEVEKQDEYGNYVNEFPVYATEEEITEALTLFTDMEGTTMSLSLGGRSIHSSVTYDHAKVVENLSMYETYSYYDDFVDGFQQEVDPNTVASLELYLELGKTAYRETLIGE